MQPGEAERPAVGYTVSPHMGQGDFCLGVKIGALCHLSVVKKLLWPRQGVGRGCSQAVGRCLELVEVSQRGRVCGGCALIYAGV